MSSLKISRCPILNKFHQQFPLHISTWPRTLVECWAPSSRKLQDFQVRYIFIIHQSFPTTRFSSPRFRTLEHRHKVRLFVALLASESRLTHASPVAKSSASVNLCFLKKHKKLRNSKKMIGILIDSCWFMKFLAPPRLWNTFLKHIVPRGFEVLHHPESPFVGSWQATKDRQLSQLSSPLPCSSPPTES